MDENDVPNPSDERAIRLRKLAQLRALGIEPFPARARVDMSLRELRRDFSALEARGDAITIAGRVMSKRMHGKSSFAHIQDGTDKFQLYFKLDIVGEEKYEIYRKFIDIGDFLQASGTLFITKTCEETLLVSDFVLLSKSLHPLPEKWHGLVDEDTRLRQRYLDVLVNPAVKERFVKRGKMLCAMREYLEGRGFVEVETPILQPLYGGASARPFQTHHNPSITSDFREL